MAAKPDLPPVFEPVVPRPETDVRADARRRAKAGAEPGTMLWADRADRFAAAVVLAPDRPFESALLVSYVGMVAIADALSALITPGMEIHFGWPNLLRINDRTVGRVTLDGPGGLAPHDVPEWLSLGVDLANQSLGEDRWQIPEQPMTSLEDEGCVDLKPAELLEKFARYLLSWIDRFQNEGFDPVRRAWLNHLPQHGPGAHIEIAGEPVEGTLDALDDAGGLVLGGDGAARVIALPEALGFGMAGDPAKGNASH